MVVARCLGLMIALALGANCLIAQDGGVSVLSPEPLFGGGWQAYGSYGHTYSFQRWKGTKAVRNPDELYSINHRFAIGANYGLPRDIPGDLTFSLLIPFHFKDFRARHDDRIIGDQVGGLGDIGVFARTRYLWWVAPDLSGQAVHMSIAGGVELPTGSTTQSRDGKRLSRGLQPGRGSVSGVLAHLFAYEAARLEMFLTVQYRWRSIGVGGSDFDFGDTFSVETNVAYRVIEEEYPGNTLSLEMGLVYRVDTPHRDNGRLVHNSGKREVSIKPALIWHPTAWWDFKLAFTVPVFRDVNGTQTVSPYSVSISLGRRF